MPHAHPLVIPQLLVDRARRTPDAPAMSVLGGGNRWATNSWSELQSRVQRLASALIQLGLQPGDRLAIQLGVRLEWELLRQATLVAGGVVVGIDPQASAEQTAHMLNVAQPVGLVATTLSGLHRLMGMHRGDVEFGIHLQDQVNRSAAESFGSETVVAPFEMLDRLTGNQVDVSLMPDDPATIIFTSGSTGTPKGIEYSHRQIMSACAAISNLYPELESGDRTICWLPMAHLYQRMINLLAIQRGMTTHFVSKPEELLGHLDAIRPAFFVGVPRLFEKIAEDIRNDPDGSQNWRTELKYAVTGSAPIDPGTLEFLVDHKVLVLEAYGTTENAIPIAASRTHARRFGSVGRPLPENELRLGSDGEIHVRGLGVFNGYRGMPTTDRISDDGFYATGDYGFVDEAGFLFLSGRKSEFIKTSTGRKIAPARIEAVYSRAPLVEQVVVFGNGRKTLVALITLSDAQRAAIASASECGATGDQMAAIHQSLRGQLAEVECELAAPERISDFAILDRPFSVRLGEVTANLKPRRERIEQLHAETIEALYSEKASPSASPMASEPITAAEKHVLITGATGVVGSSVIPLFLNDERARVYLLIRANSPEHLKVRLHQLLKNLGLSAIHPSAKSRIVALRGDVTLPRLGLDSQRYEKLAGTLTHIVHAAGNVRLNNDLKTARQDAVAPTQRILELSRKCRASGQFRKLEYISTVGVAGRTIGTVAERPYNPPEGYHNTYEAAKGESEWLVLRQSDAGLPTTIHRPSMVVGDSRTGKAMSHQVFFHLAEFFVGLRTSGIVPETGEVKMDIVPCDYVARAIHYCANDDSTAGKILHLCSGPDVSLTIAALADMLRTIFISHATAPPRLTRLPLSDFRNQLPALRDLIDDRHSQFLNALPLFLDYLDSAQTFETIQTRRILSAGHIELPDVLSYLGRIMSHYLNRPSTAKERTVVNPTESHTHGRVRENR